MGGNHSPEVCASQRGQDSERPQVYALRLLLHMLNFLKQDGSRFGEAVALPGADVTGGGKTDQEDQDTV